MPKKKPTPVTEIRLQFLTGSRAYGDPQSDSDVDIFMLVSHEEFNQLEEIMFRAHAADNHAKGRKQEVTNPIQCGKHGSGHPIDDVFLTYRSGRFNLLVTCRPEYYDCWAKGTKDLIARAINEDRRIPREEACEHIKGLCQAADFAS